MNPKDESGNFIFDDADYLDTWNVLEDLHREGLARHIGLSNFSRAQIERIADNSEIAPHALQVHY